MTFGRREVKGGRWPAEACRRVLVADWDGKREGRARGARPSRCDGRRCSTSRPGTWKAHWPRRPK